MADLDVSELNSEELLVQKHRKERKDLQCKRKEIQHLAGLLQHKLFSVILLLTNKRKNKTCCVVFSMGGVLEIKRNSGMDHGRDLAVQGTLFYTQKNKVW